MSLHITVLLNFLSLQAKVVQLLLCLSSFEALIDSLLKGYQDFAMIFKAILIFFMPSGPKATSVYFSISPLSGTKTSSSNYCSVKYHSTNLSGSKNIFYHHMMEGLALLARWFLTSVLSGSCSQKVAGAGKF